ncbi:MAG TPA: pitrilysin family protein [Candidatus Polarisedimenticolaceae bacterium]|nr:pitrilysin family protein [Candidatus Polarisedimenticolaceae bacterium]
MVSVPRVLAGLLLFLPTLAQEAAPKLSIPYEMFTLPNGLQVILHQDRRLPVVAVNTWYHVGSGREEPGRTGFAHLFEHLMFEGSRNVPEGMFDRWLEAAGGSNNASTTEDRTNYYEDAPSNALDLALFLEADRMATLLEVAGPDVVDKQRDVVKNELRQGVLNEPYGLLELELPKLLYPPGHPYSWPVIGSMEDLSAASQTDVQAFFRRYYAPNNATLVIAGDIDLAGARASVDRWFGEIPAGTPVTPLQAPPVRLAAEKRAVFEDEVQLPKLVMAWPTVQAYHPADAALTVLADLLASGKASRLSRSLVYDKRIAQSVRAFHDARAYGGQFQIEVLARPGHDLAEILAAVDAELARVRTSEPAPQELERVLNRRETGFLDGLQQVSDKADLLNAYWFHASDPDYVAEDLARFRALDASDLRTAARRWLTPERVLVSIVPRGKKELAVGGAP